MEMFAAIATVFVVDLDGASDESGIPNVFAIVALPDAVLVIAGKIIGSTAARFIEGPVCGEGRRVNIERRKRNR